MTFNTRCPACTTVFAVPPSAINASGGWVRCGRCSEVFDAVAHRDNGFNPEFDEVADRLSRQMQIPLDPVDISQQGLRPRRDGVRERTVASRPPAEPTQPTAVSKSSPVSTTNASAMEPASDPLAPSMAPSVGPRGTSGFTPPVSTAVVTPTEITKPASSLANSPPAVAANDGAPAPKKSSVERRRKSSSRNGPASQWPEPLRTERAKTPEGETDDKGASQERQEARRIRQARVRNRSEQPAATPNLAAQQSALPLDVAPPTVQAREPERSVLAPSYQDTYSGASPIPGPSVSTWLWSALAIAGLALLLLVQVFWTQRHELATHYPALKPMLTEMCQRLQCKVLPLRQLDMVAIDNSVFRLVAPSDKGDRFQLSWVVTNQALVPVAAPALELTLNDVLDRPLLRKVILPADVTGKPDLAIAPEGKWQGVLNLSVLPPEGGVKVSGYRLLAFYP